MQYAKNKIIDNNEFKRGILGRDRHAMIRTEKERKRRKGKGGGREEEEKNETERSSSLDTIQTNSKQPHHALTFSFFPSLEPRAALSCSRTCRSS
jgi:hypothetical protein